MGRSKALKLWKGVTLPSNLCLRLRQGKETGSQPLTLTWKTSKMGPLSWTPPWMTLEQSQSVIQFSSWSPSVKMGVLNKTKYLANKITSLTQILARKIRRAKNQVLNQQAYIECSWWSLRALTRRRGKIELLVPGQPLLIQESLKIVRKRKYTPSSCFTWSKTSRWRSVSRLKLAKEEWASLNGGKAKIICPTLSLLT